MSELEMVMQSLEKDGLIAVSEDGSSVRMTQEGKEKAEQLILEKIALDE